MIENFNKGIVRQRLIEFFFFVLFSERRMVVYEHCTVGAVHACFLHVCMEAAGSASWANSRCLDFFLVSFGVFRFSDVCQTKHSKQAAKKVCPAFCKRSSLKRKTYKWRTFQVAAVLCTKSMSSLQRLKIWRGCSSIGWSTKPWKRRYKTCMESE